MDILRAYGRPTRRVYNEFKILAWTQSGRLLQAHHSTPIIVPLPPQRRKESKQTNMLQRAYQYWLATNTNVHTWSEKLHFLILTNGITLRSQATPNNQIQEKLAASNITNLRPCFILWGKKWAVLEHGPCYTTPIITRDKTPRAQRCKQCFSRPVYQS